MDINRHAPVIASAEAYVDAPLSTVWAVKADLHAWPTWNPDVAWVAFPGPLAAGTAFRWKAGGLPIASTLMEVEPERCIGWTGQTRPGIRAVHVWTFEAEGEGTRVRTEESFDGWFARFFAGPARRLLAETLEKSMAALKAEAERRSQADAS